MSEILDDPIDWTRDNSLAAVPEAVSTNAYVAMRWRKINVSVFDGTPVDHEIKGVEEALLQRKNQIATGSLQAGLDWKHDFELARFSHRFHFTNLGYVRNKRSSYIGFWTEWVTEATAFYQQISLNGLKTIFIFHGAIALGALNILAQDSKPAQIVLTAKMAIVFSVLGIVVAGIGQIIIYYFGVAMVTRIRAKLVGDVKWSKARAVTRYIKRYGWLATLGNNAIYASMFWFAAYVMVLLVTLLSA